MNPLLRKATFIALALHLGASPDNSAVNPVSHAGATRPRSAANVELYHADHQRSCAHRVLLPDPGKK